MAAAVFGAYISVPPDEQLHFKVTRNGYDILGRCKGSSIRHVMPIAPPYCAVSSS